MSALWPMTTPGTPANEKPLTSIGQDSDTVRQVRLFWIQMPGWLTPRCGSLASSGLPVVVREPATTHEFEPTPSPRPTQLRDGVERRVHGGVRRLGRRAGDPGVGGCATGIRRLGLDGAVVRADGTADWVARSGTCGDHSSLPRIGGCASAS